jgi:diguanylate cyclase (GGDEF)-like protein
VALHLLDRLLSLAPAESAATLDGALSAAGLPYEQPVHGLLRLADAAHAADRQDWDEVSRQTSTAVLQLEDDIGPPIIAMTLRLATQAELARGGTGGPDTALAYCDWSARRRWDARMQLLTAARASYEAEQLRVERDHNAHQAHVDELTGLANRRGYVRHTELLRAQGTLVPLAVLVVDVDAFKSVNDRFGHAVGDGVLVKVAEVLASGTRARDLVARLGGDEFVVLLDGLDADAARRRATDMLERLGRVDWSDLADGLEVSISIGLARGSYADPGPLLDRADRALYETKRRGGGGVTVAADSWQSAPVGGTV